MPTRSSPTHVTPRRAGTRCCSTSSCVRSPRRASSRARIVPAPSRTWVRGPLRGPCCCASRACRPPPPPWLVRSPCWARARSYGRWPSWPGSPSRRPPTRPARSPRAEILRPDPPLGFVHPLVRDAVYLELSPGERELQPCARGGALGSSRRPARADRRPPPRRAGGGGAVGGGDAAGGRRLGARARGWRERDPVSPARAGGAARPRAARARSTRDLGLAEVQYVGHDAPCHLAAAYEALADPRAKRRGRDAAGLGADLHPSSGRGASGGGRRWRRCCTARRRICARGSRR